jgi:TPR repeat protein
LDVYIEGYITHETNDSERTLSVAPQTILPPKRSPEYDPCGSIVETREDLPDSPPVPVDDSTNIHNEEESDGPLPSNNPHTIPMSDNIKMLEEQALKGDMSAQVELGKAYLFGQENVLAQNSEVAMHWLLQAASQNNAEAQYLVGSAYNDGISGFSQDRSKAMELYLMAANQGHPGSQVKIGEFHLHGYNDLLKNEWAALEWFLKAAEQGDSQGQKFAGNVYENVLDPPNSLKAMKWYRQAAQQGCQESQFALGFMYDHGNICVNLDYSKAYKWYLMAAKQGQANAQASIAKMYHEGKGFGGPDYTKAKEWYTKAAEQGHEDAQVSLAEMYLKGEGTEEDPNYSEAKKWYLNAANQNSLDALYGLALMYRNIYQDFGEAKKIYRRIGMEAIQEYEDTEREEEELEEELREFNSPM